MRELTELFMEKESGMKNGIRICIRWLAEGEAEIKKKFYGYCSLVISREVFFVSEGHRKPETYARIYAISIRNSEKA